LTPHRTGVLFKSVRLVKNDESQERLLVSSFLVHVLTIEFVCLFKVLVAGGLVPSCHGAAVSVCDKKAWICL
jgi:hypothetical protein